MTNTYKLVELVREKHKLVSDYAVCKLVGISMQNISDWKRGISTGNAEKTLRLIIAAEISAEEALSIMTKSPANTSGALVKNAKQCILC